MLKCQFHFNPLKFVRISTVQKYSLATGGGRPLNFAARGSFELAKMMEGAGKGA